MYGRGPAHSELENFAKNARRDLIDPLHMKMHFRVLILNLSWGKKEIIHTNFWGVTS